MVAGARGRPDDAVLLGTARAAVVSAGERWQAGEATFCSTFRGNVIAGTTRWAGETPLDVVLFAGPRPQGVA